MKDKELYKPFKSTVKNKMYDVYVLKQGKKTKISFGDSRYKQNQNPEQRKRYLARSAGIRNKQGKLTKDDKNSANHWARKILW